MPTYDHGRLGECFGALEAQLLELLETAVPEVAVALPLRTVRPSVQAGAGEQGERRERDRGGVGLAVLGVDDAVAFAPEHVDRDVEGAAGGRVGRRCRWWNGLDKVDARVRSPHGIERFHSPIAQWTDSFDDRRVPLVLGGPLSPHCAGRAPSLAARYGVRFDILGLNLYRGGADSVAWHGDRVGRRRSHTVVAIVSLGAPRRFLLRPVGGGPSLRLTPASGDLLVLGGTCQRTWQHSVPKCASAGPRISVMFREWY